MQELLNEMSQWAENYMKTFYTEDDDIQKNILLKQAHTQYVIENCEALAIDLKCSAHDVILAKMIGLFHDIGRFKQYSVYRTFNDRISENHALLGLKVLSDIALLNRLSAEDREVLQFAIKNHNAIEIEATQNQRAILFAKIIRDADKLDIYRVLEPTLEAADGSGYSEVFVQSFLAGKQCDYTYIKTQADRKLVRLLWVYNMYFSWTMQRMLERGHVEKILACLPENETTAQGFVQLQKYMKEKAYGKGT